MRGKFAFIVGLAAGYVLGTRAGRERYEQIKAGVKSVWDSPTVKRGRDQVSDYVSDVAVNVQDSVVEAGKGFVQSVIDFAKARSAETAKTAETAAKPATASASTAKPAAKKSPAKKPAAKKPAAKKSTTSKTASSKSTKE